MITITPDLLRLIMSVRNSLNDHGLWVAFTGEFKAMSDKMMGEALHFVPDPSDFNAQTRQDVLRGASIATDIFSHALLGPEEMVEQLVNITKVENSAVEQMHY